jgi:Type IV leader peptidase family
MTGLSFAGGALACAVAAIAAVTADRFSVHPLRAGEASDPDRGDTLAAGDTGTRRLAASRTLVIALSAVTASALVYARTGWTAPLPSACCLCAAGPPLAATDLTEHRLPDKLTLPAIALTAALLTTASWQNDDFAALGRAAIAAAAAAVFFLALALITRQIGGGDIKPQYSPACFQGGSAGTTSCSPCSPGYCSPL